MQPPKQKRYLYCKSDCNNRHFKSKKYFDPSEFGIELIHGELGESLIDFEKPRISNKNAIAEAMSKIDISGDFLKQHHLRYAMTDYAKQKEKNAIKEKTTGKKW